MGQIGSAVPSWDWGMAAGLLLVSVCGGLAALPGLVGVGRPLPGWLISALCSLTSLS